MSPGQDGAGGPGYGSDGPSSDPGGHAVGTDVLGMTSLPWATKEPSLGH